MGDSPAVRRFLLRELFFSQRYLSLIFVLLIPVWSSCLGQGAYSTSTSMLANGVALKYSDSTGTIEYDWVAPAQGSSNSLGTIKISTHLSGSPVGELSLNPYVLPAGGNYVVTNVSLGSISGSNGIAISYQMWGRPAHVIIKPFFDGKIAAATISSDVPNIAFIDIGGWPTNLSSRQIAVPYYTQAPKYFESLNLFANAYFDPFNSNGSYFYSTRSIYSSTTGGVHNTLLETLKFVVSPNIDDVFPVIHNPPSPHLSQLAGKMVFDLGNGQQFEQMATYLKRLGDNGIRNCAVIIHRWQHFGYDNALPDQYPAYAPYGGDTGLKDATAAARNDSCLVALHENYADYYPNYDRFTPSAVIRTGNDQLALSWFNHATGIQSYATKGTMLQANASTESPEIHSLYGTTASFIDVLSASTPWWRDDLDQATPGAAKFATYRDSTTALWAYERQTHGGPVFGEGRNHWFWSGLLDGVEAQFGGEGAPIPIGLEAPLFVDFDLTRIHPLQVNEGMGYYERWVGPGENMFNTQSLDAYRMQEIAYGHAPFLGGYLWSSVPRALLEQNLVTPVAARYGVQNVSAIQYEHDGSWVDASTLLKSGSTDFSQVQITYSNGDRLFANSRPVDVSWNNMDIPQFGWGAQGNGYLAYTARKNGIIADYVQTPDYIYADARNQNDLAAAEAFAEPQVEGFRQTGSRNFQMQVGFNVINGPAPSDAKVFLHLVNPQLTTNAGIVSAQTQSTVIPATEWQSGQTQQASLFQFHLPGIVPDGTYSVRVGIYYTNNGSRASLYGNSDGTGRYMLGNITVANGGNSITFTPVPVVPPTRDPRMNASGSVVNFEAIHTDGMVWLERSNTSSTSKTWTIRDYPRYRNVTVQVNGAVVPMPSMLTCDSGASIQPHSVSGGFWQVNLAGLHACQWTAQ
ncbi:MAG: hypothetical protein HIU87_04135 [Acidobacteria bacterium]|nr:hypothetical protein [Acidobacteriota bacterium]